MSDRTLAAFAPLVRSGGAWRVTGHARPPRRLRPSWFGGAPRAVATWYHMAATLLRHAWRRHRSRRCLLQMDPHLLKDIGISYAEAEAEVNKPFWIG